MMLKKTLLLWVQQSPLVVASDNEYSLHDAPNKRAYGSCRVDYLGSLGNQWSDRNLHGTVAPQVSAAFEHLLALGR